MLCWLILVAFFWGTSGPLMKYVTQDVKVPETRIGVLSPFSYIITLFSRWKFILAYIYDQAGSAVYYYVLGRTDLSTAVPIANGLTFVFSGLTEAIVNKRTPSRATVEGISLIVIGVYICYSSK